MYYDQPDNLRADDEMVVDGEWNKDEFNVDVDSLLHDDEIPPPAPTIPTQNPAPAPTPTPTPNPVLTTTRSGRRVQAPQ